LSSVVRPSCVVCGGGTPRPTKRPDKPGVGIEQRCVWEYSSSTREMVNQAARPRAGAILAIQLRQFGNVRGSCPGILPQRIGQIADGGSIGCFRGIIAWNRRGWRVW
jgi:hypothetical protein